MNRVPLLEELRLIARNGLLFAENPQDEQRYERILELVEQAYGETLEIPSEQASTRLQDSLGYILGATVAIIDSEGRILLMQRTDNDAWCLPGGFVEPDETPADAAIRETEEETGLEVEITDLVHTNYLPANEYGNSHKHVHFVYLGKETGGTLDVSDEGRALAYRLSDEVPEWHPCHDTYATKALNEWTKR